MIEINYNRRICLQFSQNYGQVRGRMTMRGTRKAPNPAALSGWVISRWA